MICVAKVGIFSYIHEAKGSLPDLAAFFYVWTLAVDIFFILSTETISSHETRSTDATQSDTAVPTSYYVEAI